MACGSGDAQTLCITDDDNVWSWGDGDYGKLGRGGSDGCKIPMKIESLAGLGVVKVECGSQFSVALTRSGSVYTWYAARCNLHRQSVNSFIVPGVKGIITGWATVMEITLGDQRRWLRCRARRS